MISHRTAWARNLALPPEYIVELTLIAERAEHSMLPTHDVEAWSTILAADGYPELAARACELATRFEEATELDTEPSRAAPP